MGSKRDASIVTRRPQGSESLLDSFLRGEAQVGPQARLGGLVDDDWSEGQGQVEAARADDLAQRVEAWCDGVTLPTRDLRAVAPNTLTKLILREAGAQARLSDQHPARHAPIVRRRVATILRNSYVTGV